MEDAHVSLLVGWSTSYECRSFPREEKHVYVTTAYGATLTPQRDHAPPIHRKVTGTQKSRSVTSRANGYRVRRPPDDPPDESPHWTNTSSTCEPTMTEPTVAHIGQ